MFGKARDSTVAVGLALIVLGFVLHRHEVRARASRVASVPPAETYFPAGSVWTQDARGEAVNAQSDAILQWLAGAGGWGGGRMRVDFSLRVLKADASTPRVPFRPGKDFYREASDVVASVPLPPGGGMEARTGYDCPVGKDDCHLIVVDRPEHRLYEAFDATSDGHALTATFLAVWDLDRVYPPSGRGDQCTSADAAGYPIAPLLFNADELARGHIDHAIRFILPNDRIRAGVFVHPATHAGGPQGPALAPPYGAHLRLKAGYDVSHLKPAARVVAEAMKQYGMFLADGGTITLTAQNDADTHTKYSDVGFESGDLSSLKVTDFEVLQSGPVFHVTNVCVRNP